MQSVIVQLILITIQIMKMIWKKFTKADIPTNIDTVLSNISMEGKGSKNDSQDVSYLGE